MIKNNALRGLLGMALVVALAGAAPTMAATRPSTTQTSTIAPAATCSPGAKACPIRISFASGAYSGQASAHMSNINSTRWFVVNARAGQHMIVIVKGAGPTRGIVYFPGGGYAGQPGGRVFDATLKTSGDYRIRVNESSMGEEWSGRVDVVVVIY
jgi:hypothetical protein